MRHAVKVTQLAKVIGYAHQLGITFKPSTVQGFMELNTWPETMKAKDVKEHFQQVLGIQFELVA